MTAISSGAHPPGTDRTVTELVPVRVATLRADEQTRRARRPDPRPDSSSREHARRPQPHLVRLGFSAAHAGGDPLLADPVRVHRHDVRSMHRTGRAGVRAASLVAMAQNVRVAARADVDQGVGLETEGRLQALEHVIGTLAQSHPRRELRLPCLEYPRRSRLRHAGETKRETKLVSFLGGQLASHRGSEHPDSPPGRTRADNAVPRGVQPPPSATSVNHLNECGSPFCLRVRLFLRTSLARSPRVPGKSRRSRVSPSSERRDRRCERSRRPRLDAEWLNVERDDEARARESAWTPPRPGAGPVAR